MKKTRSFLAFALTVATLILGFATNAQAAIHWPWHRAVTPAAAASTAAPASAGGPLAQLNDSIHGLLSGNTDLPVFTANDLANAKAILTDGFARTGNPYDQAGMACADKISLHLAEFQLLASPASSPAPLQLAAPVTGIFSSIAAIQVTAEAKSDQVTAVNAQLAAALTLFRDGLPPDVHIACAYIAVEPHALLHVFATHTVTAPPTK